MTINWPARSRADYPIPTSALSAKITVTDSSLAGGVTWTVERDAARTEAHSVTYTAPDALPVKHLFAAVRFYTQPGGAGSWVSECLVNAPVDAAGDGLPTITTGTGTAFVTAVDVAPLSLAPGETKPVQFTAKSIKDAAVALTPGSAFVSVVSGQDKVKLIEGDTRQIEGVAPGTARLRVVVDGITGEADVTVSSPVQLTLDLPTISLTTGGTQQFSATVTGVTGGESGVTWSVQEGEAGGTITPDGLYTAPSTAGTYHVVAAAKADPAKTATSTVTVTQDFSVKSGDIVIATVNHIIAIDDMTGKNLRSFNGHKVDTDGAIKGVALDSKRRIYFWVYLDSQGTNIQRIDDLSGKNRVKVRAPDGFESLHIDKQDRLYFTCYPRNSSTARLIRMDDLNGTNAQTIGLKYVPGTNDKPFFGISGNPVASTTDGNGTIYLVAFSSPNLFRLGDISGSNYGIREVSLHSGSNGLTVDAQGRILVTAGLPPRLTRFDGFDGALKYIDGTQSSGEYASYLSPCVDAVGNIYFVDDRKRVLRVNDDMTNGWLQYTVPKSLGQNPLYQAVAIAP